MIKKNKWMLLATSVIILLPVLAGLYLWKDLPDTVATHFGTDNEPNGWNSKTFAVFGIPCIILGLHWFALIATELDSKKKNIHGRMMMVLFWICPLVSLLVSAIIYVYAMGLRANIGFVVMLFIGVLFIAIGNYLPKCRTNRSVGIRLPWTLGDQGNWQRTHRVAGWSLSAGGALVLATACFCNPWLFFAIIAVSSIVPIAYSFVYYRRHRQGRAAAGFWRRQPPPDRWKGGKA